MSCDQLQKNFEEVSQTNTEYEQNNSDLEEKNLELTYKLQNFKERIARLDESNDLRLLQSTERKS